MNVSYVTLLSSDNYLHGVLGLWRSLKRSATSLPLSCMVTRNLSDSVLDELREAGVRVTTVPFIPHPNASFLEEEEKYKASNYTKLNLFGLTEFTKVVYLDADAVVVKNVDHLFERPHMSAVVAGSDVHAEWTNLNSGVMVVEPDADLFADILEKVGKVEVERCLGGDQQFLHAYFVDWPNQTELHLPLSYNVLVEDKLPSSEVHVLHFVGPVKPWNSDHVYGVLWRFFASL